MPHYSYFKDTAIANNMVQRYMSVHVCMGERVILKSIAQKFQVRVRWKGRGEEMKDQ